MNLKINEDSLGFKALMMGRQMARQVKAPIPKPDRLSLIPRTHVLEGQN